MNQLNKKFTLTIILKIIFFLFLNSNLWAQLQGTVVNWQGQGVAGCQVSLAAATGNATTAANGAFTIPASAIHTLQHNVSSSRLAFYSGSRLYFQTTGKTDISIFTAAGSLLRQTTYHNLVDGQYRIDVQSIIPDYRLMTPLYLKVSTGNKATTLQIIYQPGVSLKSGPEKVSGREFALKKSRSAADSLVVDCSGPNDIRVAIQSYTGNLGDVQLGQPPHIVFVMTDDMSKGELAIYGNDVIVTPNLDDFWSKSTRFENHHVAPTCSPTRTQLLSGRHEFRYGVTHTIYGRERMAPTAYTIAQVLSDAGYKTGVFGKWHVGDDDEYQPHLRGFDEALVHRSGAMGSAKYINPDNLYHNGVRKTYQGYITDIWFREALAWTKANKDEGPLFTYIATNTPHEPVVVPDNSYRTMYNNLYGDQPLDGEGYYGMITRIDEQFGEMMDSLRAFGMEENTIVVFTCDNGHALLGYQGTGINGDGTLKPDALYNAGMRGGKHHPYDGGHLVPNFWYWPGRFKQGVDINSLTAMFDTYPTLADIAGASIPDTVALDGRSFWPLLENSESEWSDRYLVVHEGRWQQGEAANSKYRWMGIRSTKYNFVYNNQLYDVENDPGETNNIINDHPDIVAAMRAWYDDWWQETLPLMVNEQ